MFPKIKIAAFGDLHIRSTVPVHRKDDYYNKQFSKLRYCLSKAEKSNVKYVLFPGDVFNNYGRDSYAVAYDFAKVLTEYNMEYLAVMGQHDIRYHRTDLTETPFHLLSKTSLLKVLGEQPYVVKERLHFYGSSWDDEIPEVLDKEALNILVAHKMVVGKSKIWPGQTDFVYAKELLHNHSDYNLFVTGDNHSTFYHSSGNNILVNCGSLLRMRSDQKDHKPCFYIYNTSKQKAYKKIIPIEPYEDVFDVEKAETQKLDRKKKKRDKKFAASLQVEFNKLSFDDLIQKKIKSKKLPERVRYYIEKAYLSEGA
jgi:DNA repair exonuclease SbcCD nuclease subunit